jgi:hypothetical protein
MAAPPCANRSLNDSGRAVCLASVGTGCSFTAPGGTLGWVKAAGITQPRRHHSTVLWYWTATERLNRNQLSVSVEPGYFACSAIQITAAP